MAIGTFREWLREAEIKFDKNTLDVIKILSEKSKHNKKQFNTGSAFSFGVDINGNKVNIYKNSPSLYDISYEDIKEDIDIITKNLKLSKPLIKDIENESAKWTLLYDIARKEIFFYIYGTKNKFLQLKISLDDFADKFSGLKIKNEAPEYIDNKIVYK